MLVPQKPAKTSATEEKTRFGLIGYLGPRRRHYPLLGFLLAMGAPTGYLLVRAVAVGVVPTLSWILQELQQESLTYGYLAISTTIIFLLIGYILGEKEDQLLEVSNTDPLTGLFNRRYFERKLYQEARNASQGKKPFSLLLIDLDRFKNINDTLGHSAGDQALQTVAKAIQGTLRAGDVAARYGGDEFIILLPATPAEGAAILAERLLGNLALLTKETGAPPLSISIGFAAQKGECRANLGELFRMADQALYEVKAQGGGHARCGGSL